MSIRTNRQAVQDMLVIGYNYDPAINLTPFIQRASNVVDNVASLALQYKNVTIDAATLEIVEALLACHFYQLADPGYTGRTTAGAGGQFKVGTPGEGFESTDYGRNACSVDWTGTLLAINRRKFASAAWLGKNPTSQIPWEDRR